MKKYSIKGIPVRVNSQGMILVEPARLAEVLDQGVNPLQPTPEQIAQNRVDAEQGLTPFPHDFAQRMAGLVHE